MYRENEFGLLVRLDPKAAKKRIDEAFQQTDDNKPGRADEKAAAALDIGKSSLKRFIRQLADQGLTVIKPRARRQQARARRELAQSIGHAGRQVPKKRAG